MTRVVVDRAVCMSSGVCEMEAPKTFELDADGLLRIGEVTDVEAVATAVRACPTGALQLVD